MRLARLILTLLALLLSTACYAAPVSDTDADDFIKAYSFDVVQALVDVNLSHRVDSGQLTKAQAECAKTSIRWDDFLTRARPIVADTFPDSRTVSQATEFFLSPTGTKLKEFGITTLKDILKAKAVGRQPPPPASLPPSFTAEDVRVAGAFNNSVVGQRFGLFVTEGLPKLQRVDLLGPAIASCKVHSSK